MQADVILSYLILLLKPLLTPFVPLLVCLGHCYFFMLLVA